MREAYNIVFFKYNDKNETKKSACVFYTDGTIEQLPYEDALEVAANLANSLNIKKNEIDKFSGLINKERIHVVSGQEFEKNFKKYIAPAEVIKASKKPETIEEVIDRELDKVESTPVKTTKKKTKKEVPEVVPFIVTSNAGDLERVVIKDTEDTEDITPIVASIQDTKKEEKKENPTYKTSRKKKEGFISRIGKSKPVKKIAYGAATLAIILGLGSFAGQGVHLNKVDMAGAMANSNVAAVTAPAEAGANQTEVKLNSTAVASNDYYDGYTYEQLIEVTNSQIQKEEMTRIHDALYGFNDTFANAHLEEGKDIKAALTFEEVVALSQAYNDFTPQEIAAIFNGYGFRSGELENAYKTATLQLMGAHAIEDREHPVDMSMLLTTQEGRNFYNKYHELYLRVLETDGEEKIAAIDAFYAELNEDFPITDDVREVGISHADSRTKIESYYLSVTPMVASMEMIAQNYDEIDHTMADKAIAYFNDLGLCNRAEDNFEIVQQVTMGACVHEDDTNPLYIQYRDAMIKELKDKNNYVIDDAHRELSKLDKFQDRVNWHVEKDGQWDYHGETYTSTDTWTETKTWTETETREEVTREEKQITDEAKAEVDAEIDKENEEAKRQAEDAAKKEQERLQKEADEQAKKVEEEVRQDHEDMQQDIDNANQQIDKNNSDNDTSNDNPVNESDFGDHGVDFDEDHSNENGDLDNSVENITTDDSGYVKDEPLPDPNVTGQEFDAQAESYYSENYEVEIVEEAPVNNGSNEAAVDSYVESLAEEAIEDEEIIQYIRRN